MEKTVSLCKRRRFIFQSSEIYGGGEWVLGLRSAGLGAEAECEGALVKIDDPAAGRCGAAGSDHDHPQIGWASSNSQPESQQQAANSCLESRCPPVPSA